MAGIISASINLEQIEKAKIISGKKGKYLPITIIVNDDVNAFGQNVAITQEQSKEERDAKTAKNYIGNGKVVWSNDAPLSKADLGKQSGGFQKTSAPSKEVDDDLPF